MANRQFRQDIGTLTPGLVVLSGHFTTTTSGTISTASGGKKCYGFNVTKTGSETGRYTVTLEDAYNELLGVVVTVKGTADAAYTNNKGAFTFIRNDAVATVASRTFNIQFALNADGGHTDAELEDAAKVYITIFLKNSSVDR